MRVLITGGAGFLGRELTRQILVAHPDWTVVIYSRDEGKQLAMRQEIPEGGVSGARYMLGDICDTDRLIMAMRNCDYVIHAAAMKCIEVCEYDSMEAVRVNVNGTQSVIRACLECGVSSALYIGTDKGVNPVGIYGKTKGLAESMWIQANTYGYSFSAVRTGNVAGSTKSVFHHWANLAMRGEKIPVTSMQATRFYWLVGDSARFALSVMTHGTGHRGGIYIPSMCSYRMIDIAKRFGDVYVTGWRCPEKEHEELYTVEESTHMCYDMIGGEHEMCILPKCHSWCSELRKPDDSADFAIGRTSLDCIEHKLPDFLTPEAYGVR